MERMTSPYSAYTQPDTFQRPMYFHSFDGIGRATGTVSAIVTQKGADEQLVSFYQTNEGGFHEAAHESTARIAERLARR